jgi:hypothetical protein
MQPAPDAAQVHISGVMRDVAIAVQSQQKIDCVDLLEANATLSDVFQQITTES